jgi:TRAP-type C4-dicarboxylate transport system substrate-binding protein
MKVPNPIQYMTGKGMTVSFLTDDQLKAFALATAPVMKKWAKVIGPDLVEKAKADMAD